MEGYFSIKVKFVLTVLLGVLFYVSYLYIFKEQKPTAFRLSKDCTEVEIQEGSAKANLFFDRYFEERMLKKSEGASQADYAYKQSQLVYLEDSILLPLCLDDSTLFSARLLKDKLKIALESYTYRYYNYPVNSINGEQVKIISVLIEEHPIKDLRDAEAYINSIQKLDEKTNKLIAELELRSKKNIILPKFLFPDVLISIQKMIKNQVDKPNLLVMNFNQKIEKLDLDLSKKEALKKRLIEVFDTVFVPSYQKLYKYLVDLEKNATNEIGIWNWNAKTDFYAFKLKEKINTSLTPEEIYNLGKEEVNRLHKEMEEILKKLNYTGDLQDFFKFLQTNPQFYYPNTNVGKQAYIDRTEEALDFIQTKLRDFFLIKPNKKIVVKPLENRYQKWKQGGKESGTYYVDLANMKHLPNYMIDAISYYEAIPGHSFQCLIEEYLVDLPKFRRFESPSMAYAKGWGMYATYLAKEMGAYQDPYANFGRLSLELWRACHLVVDVGIHQKKWTKEEAVDYYKKNTTKQKAECLRMVEEHIVLPAESIAYKIGMITILELRKRAELELGTKFNLQEFHEVILNKGNVPLDVLQDLVEDYIQLKTE